MNERLGGIENHPLLTAGWHVCDPMLGDFRSFSVRHYILHLVFVKPERCKPWPIFDLSRNVSNNYAMV